MEKVKPSRPSKAKRKAPTKQVENKYAPKMKVGTPQIGRTIAVETVGLGKLKVITQNGDTNI